MRLLIGLSEESEKDTGGHRGSDHAGHVRGHGMGQEVVAGVCFQTHLFGHARRIRHGGHAGVADERVDLLAFRQEEVHELREEHAEGGGDDERSQTEAENERGPAGEEHVSLGGGTHGDTDERGHDIDERTAGRGGEALGDAALLEQVAEEEHAQQRQAGGDDEGRAEEADDREDDLLALADGARFVHPDQALLLGGEQQHDRLLDHGHEGHVGVGRHGDRTHQFRSQLGAQEDGGRAVRAADDADGTGLIGGEAEHEREQVGAEDTHLCSGADQDEARLRDQGREVRHGPDAEEYQWRVPAVLHAVVQDVQHGVLFVDADLEADAGRGIEEEGDVADDHAESDRHEQQRLPMLDNTQGDETQADADHQQVLPGAVGKSGKLPELLEAVDDVFH